MELSTFSTDLRSTDIRPSDSIKQYISLLEKEATKLLEGAVESSCPACGDKNCRPAFEKFGFQYVRCESCTTLFSPNRPKQEKLDEFYLGSEARTFWLQEIGGASSAARGAKVFDPLVDWVSAHCGTAGVDVKDLSIADCFPVNPGFSSQWLNSYQKLDVVEPRIAKVDLGLSQERVKKEEEAGRYQALMFADALDRAENPQKWLLWAREHLEPGGLCFVTGISSSGLDVLHLDGHLEALVPPDRLNSFSFEGFSQLCDRSGFELIEFSTPGNLDVENLRKAVESGELESEFFNYLFRVRKDEQLLDNFKTFLQSNRLSSSLRAVLKLK